MKKIILVAMVSILALSTFIYPAAANEDYDHNALLEYDGYGKALYDSIVEETTYFTGQYTDNKEYVSNSIDKIKDYADFWWNEQKIEGDTWGERIKEVISEGAGYALTVGDWIKNLFSDYEEENVEQPVYDGGFYTYSRSMYNIKDPYCLDLSSIGSIYGNCQLTFSASVSSSKGYVSVSVGGNYHDITKRVCPNVTECTKLSDDVYYLMESGNLYSFISKINSLLGSNIHLRTKTSDVPVQPGGGDTNFNRFIDYIRNDSAGKSLVVPKPKASLTCPDGTSIPLTISGSTFINSDGSVMTVEKDGTATHQGQQCNLSWEKPVVKYLDDRAVIETPEGKWEDIETGEVTGGDGKDDEDGEDGEDGGDVPAGEGCDGVLCFLSDIAKAIASLAKTIGGLVKKILDGLLALFVPDDLDFVTEEFTGIKKVFDEKFNILKDIKDTLTSAFDSGSASNPLESINFNLPILNEPLKFDTGIIETGVPTLKRVISGVMVLFTFLYIYRKITGRGGVMEK